MNVILALDIATVTGWALGQAGAKPLYGTVRLKKPEEHPRAAAFNMMAFLADMFQERPDLVVWEEPMPPVFHVNRAAKTGVVHQNNASMTLPIYLDGILYACCRRKGIECAFVNRMKILKHFTGKAKWGGRDEAKRAVISRCHSLGLMQPHEKNDDIADAIAIHDWASAHRFRKCGSFALFDQGARA